MHPHTIPVVAASSSAVRSPITVVSWSAGPGLGGGRCCGRCAARTRGAGERPACGVERALEITPGDEHTEAEAGRPLAHCGAGSEPSGGARPHPHGDLPCAARHRPRPPVPRRRSSAARSAPLLASGLRGLVAGGQLTHKFQEVPRRLCPGPGARAPRPRDGRRGRAGSRRPPRIGGACTAAARGLSAARRPRPLPSARPSSRPADPPPPRGPSRHAARWASAARGVGAWDGLLAAPLGRMRIACRSPRRPAGSGGTRLLGTPLRPETALSRGWMHR